MTTLESRLLAAHAAGDGRALVGIYQQAAAQTNDPNAAAFFLTHAHVFALETGHPDASALRAKLIAAGRETPLAPPLPPKR
jgi:hypothetical protein